MHEIQFVQAEGKVISGGSTTPLMLILDVKTQWLSTHQMLCMLLQLYILWHPTHTCHHARASY
jgi:hypothetical protein